MTDAPGVMTHELRVGDAVVGRLRLRARSGEEPPAALLRVITTLIASEVERLRAPERASEAAQSAFLRAVLRREVTDRGDLVARGEELGIDLSRGGAVVVVRAHHLAPTEDDWRARVLAAAERAARTSAPGSLAAVIAPAAEGAGQVVLLVPEAADDGVRRVAESIARELQARCTASPSRSGTRASPSIPSTSTAPATRRCWPPTSPRRAPPRSTIRPRCSPSRTPAPTACCCRP